MNKENHIERRIQETLNSINQIEKANPPEFFYTRLKARMESELIEQPKLRWLLKPAFVIPLLLLTISFNVFTIQKLSQKQNTEESAKEEFISTYNLNTTDDLEIY